MLCSRKLPVSKKIMEEGRGIKIFRREIFVSQGRSLSQLNPFDLSFRKLPVSKKIKDKSGVSRFPVGNFMSCSAEKFRRGTLLCCVREKLR